VVKRSKSYGQVDSLSFLDKLGQWLSVRNLSGPLKSVVKRNSLADIGAGFNAELSSPIWGHFKNVYLFDISLNQDLANPANVVVHFIEGDLEETLKKVKIELDFVIMNNLLEHIDKSVELLCDVKKNMSSGGILFINVPSWTGKIFLEFAAFRLRLSPPAEMEDHKRYYSKHELWLEIRAAGFNPSKISVKRSKFGLNTSAIVQN
jgi:SAM-dependent methyltransferase